MSDQKRHTGFRTPAAMLQEKLDRVKAGLGADKQRWLDNFALSEADGREHLAVVDEALEADDDDAAFQFSRAVADDICLQFICLVGAEVSEMHERLAAVQKQIAELKAAVR